jgi:hypothetical protein
MSEATTPSSPRWLGPAGVLAGYTVLALVYGAQLAAYHASQGQPPGFGESLLVGGIEWHSWALLTPLILSVARRVRATGRPWPLQLALHLPPALLFAVLHMGLHSGLRQLLLPFEDGWPAAWRYFLWSLSKTTDFDVLVYLSIVGLHAALRSSRQVREEALRASQLEAQLAQAQLHLLRSQLLPHFLFNTLHAISALMHRDVHAADRMVGQLSELLRASLERDGRHEVPLYEEAARPGARHRTAVKNAGSLSVRNVRASGSLDLQPWKRSTVAAAPAPGGRAPRTPTWIGDALMENVSRAGPAWLLALALVSLPVREAQGATPLEDNRRITLGYIQLAYEMQALVDPGLQPGGASSVRPVWYGFAPHASQTAGQGMLGADLARRIIRSARSWPSYSVSYSLDRAGITGPMRGSIQSLAQELVVRGLPVDVSTSLASLATALNWSQLADSRVLFTTASRFMQVYSGAPGYWPLDKAESIVRTFERTLHEGNLAVYSDIAAAGRAYLDWRAARQGAVTPAQVLAEFSLPGAIPSEAQTAYTYAVAHAHDTPRPHQFHQLFPGMSWKSLLVAAYALYEEARLAPTAARRDALIAMGNNFIAWREQYDMAQPVFTPAVPRPDEVSRSTLTRLFTPFLKTDFGTYLWNYSDFAYSRPDPDWNPFTAPPTEYNWGIFWDRWTGILHAFDQVYLGPSAVWAMPEPVLN